jgi:hypothetical protein
VAGSLVAGESELPIVAAERETTISLVSEESAALPPRLFAGDAVLLTVGVARGSELRGVTGPFASNELSPSDDVSSSPELDSEVARWIDSRATGAAADVSGALPIGVDGGSEFSGLIGSASARGAELMAAGNDSTASWGAGDAAGASGRSSRSGTSAGLDGGAADREMVRDAGCVLGMWAGPGPAGETASFTTVAAVIGAGAPRFWSRGRGV